MKSKLYERRSSGDPNMTRAREDPITRLSWKRRYILRLIEIPSFDLIALAFVIA
jgi:hypothetical protein